MRRPPEIFLKTKYTKMDSAVTEISHDTTKEFDIKENHTKRRDGIERKAPH